ncbi:MAG: hypothetical protein ACTSWC_13225, partial [Promethearchaeota archaeon]
LALIIMGVDLEEFIASLTGAIGGLPELAVRNVIGNNIISLTFVFGLPAFFFPVILKKAPSTLLYFLWGLTLTNLLSMIIQIPMWIFGVLNLIIYGVYLIYAFRNLRRPLIEEHELNEALEKQRMITNENKEQNVKRIRRSLVGLIIVAAGTNVEESSILFKSIKKNCTELGMASLIRKIIWNSGITFGISALIIFRDTFYSWNLILVTGLMVILIIPFISFLFIKKKEISKKNALVLMILFGIYLLLSIII